jgi:hypothetical protein
MKYNKDLWQAKVNGAWYWTASIDCWLWLYKRGPSGENQKIGELYQDDSKETFLDAIQRLTRVKEIDIKPY